jgi:primosomal replication protein N''
VQVTTLNYHYRSQKKELINFSNNVFYSGTLNVCDAPIKNGKGLTLINTRGRNVNGINKAESDAIIAEIEKICDQPNHGSVGVITITKEQAYFIKSQLYLSKNQNVLNELVKVDSSTGEDISLFVKTIEDVQGEERDNIFISCS